MYNQREYFFFYLVGQLGGIEGLDIYSVAIRHNPSMVSQWSWDRDKNVNLFLNMWLVLDDLWANVCFLFEQL